MRTSLVLTLSLLAGLVLVAGGARADTPVFDIQLGLIPEQTVLDVNGVVVTGVGRYGFFAQEPDLDPTYGRQYSGVWVFTNSPPTVHRGDLVDVHGRYVEYFGMAEIDVTPGCGCDGAVTIVGQHAEPDPVSVTIPEINDQGDFNEAYECVLVRVDREDPSLVALPTRVAYAEWKLSRSLAADADSILMEQYSSYLDFTYDVPDTNGGEVTFAQGVLVYNRDHFKIAPRNCEEDLGVPCVPHLRGAYATTATGVAVQFGVDLEETSAENIANYELVSGAQIFGATLDPGNTRRVFLATENLGNGNEETIIASRIVSAEGIEMTKSESQNFRTGITPISQIQYAFDPPSNDASPLVGEVVTIRGRVSALDGSNYYFLQDDDGHEWDGIYVYVARVLPLKVGDELKVAGQVNEYYGMTELGYRSGVDYFNRFGTTAPVVTNTLTTADLKYRDPLRGAEPWEAALVRLEGAGLDSLEGVVGPYYKEWLLYQPGLPDTAKMDIDAMNGDKAYHACIGDTINITGVLDYTYDQYHIWPRSGRGADIEVIYDNPACEPTGLDDADLALGRTDLRGVPNPFNPRTTIRFRLSQAARVNLSIHDASGRVVRTLLDDAQLAAGMRDAIWDGRDDEGRSVGSGTYFARFSSTLGETATKLILLK